MTSVGQLVNELQSKHCPQLGSLGLWRGYLVRRGWAGPDHTVSFKSSSLALQTTASVCGLLPSAPQLPPLNDRPPTPPPPSGSLHHAGMVEKRTGQVIYSEWTLMQKQNIKTVGLTTNNQNKYIDSPII